MTPATLTAKASEAVGDQLHAAKRALTERVQEFEDLRDTATIGIRRAPFRAVGAAFGAGIVLGAALGWMSHRPNHKQ